MRKSRLWKVILEYGTGILILILTVLMAWFLPEWYSEWRDRESMGKMVINSRDEIQFLDRDFLDVAGRFRILEKQIDGKWEYTMTMLDPVEEEIIRCNRLIQKWETNGLVPGDVVNTVTIDCLREAHQIELFVEDNVINVEIMRFTSLAAGDALEEWSVSVIADMQTDLLYYVSFAGSNQEIRDYEIRAMGYTPDEIRNSDADQILHLQQEDYSRYDFASVCGANQAEIVNNVGLYLIVKLSFDRYTGYAYRTTVFNTSDCGMAIMYGSPYWVDLVTATAQMLGSAVEYPCSWEEVAGVEDGAAGYNFP